MRIRNAIFMGCCAGGLAMLAAAPASATLWDIQKEIELYGDLNQNDIPGIGGVCCGPAAAVNSFWYLQNKYPHVYGTSLVPAQGSDLNGDMVVDYYDDLIAAAQTLASPQYMNTTAPGGTFHDDFIMGKRQYIEDRLPGWTRYEAQDSWDWTGQHQRPEWVDPIAPTWDFLYNELVDCEDVEILLSFTDGGHFLTLTSFHWDDADNDMLMEIGEAFIDYIDPWTGLYGTSNIWQSGAIIETDYTAGAWISMAISESPIPGPAALTLLLGAALIGSRRRR
jgi:hypothetical protein